MRTEGAVTRDEIMKMDTSAFNLDKSSGRPPLRPVGGRLGSDRAASGLGRRGSMPRVHDGHRDHTVVFLRDLLATRASFDPEVTSFLSDALEAAARRLGTPLRVGGAA